MLSLKCHRFFSVSKIMKAKTIILSKKFDGFPSENNFQLIEESLPPLKDGEFLAEAEYLSVDPYMRVYPGAIGQPMIGQQVAKIIESKNAKFPVGEYVTAEFGWRTHTIGDDSLGGFLRFPPQILKDYNKFPRSLALGILGMPGNAAQFAFLNICKPKPGNTVVVSGAAGAVGTTVGQIAKIQGCKVIGITSSDAKGKRLVDEVGFDNYVNYKSQSFEEDLVKATPDRVDAYFDNVGGEISTSVLNRMNKFGNVAVCGASSTYNESTPKAREVQTPVKVQHLVMEGFNVQRWKNEWEKGIEQNKTWLRSGQLKYFETITNGFENTPRAFMELLRGGNFGKAIVKL